MLQLRAQSACELLSFCSSITEFYVCGAILCLILLFDNNLFTMKDKGLQHGSSLADKIQLNMKTDPDFPQKFKQRLLIESYQVMNPLQFISSLVSKGALGDGSSDIAEICALKEMVVQLAIRVTCSGGTDAIVGLVDTLQESGDSHLIHQIETWLEENSAAGVDRSEVKRENVIVKAPISEDVGKEATNINEFSSSGTKFIDKIISHVETDFMEQLERRLTDLADKVVNVPEFGASLVREKVLDKVEIDLTSGPELQVRHWTEKAIKLACSKRAMRSLVIALQSSANEHILEETLKLLENSERRKLKNQDAAQVLTDQQTAAESNLVGPEFFYQPPPSNELLAVATFNCEPKGTYALHFDQKGMMAGFVDGTIKMWNWLNNDEQTIKCGTKAINCLQYDEEIIVFGTYHGVVYLYDAITLEEKWSMRLGGPIYSLKFFKSTLVVFTDLWGDKRLWWVEISRLDKRLLNQRHIDTSKWVGQRSRGVLIDSDYCFFYVKNAVYIYETKSGLSIKDDEGNLSYFSAPSDISSLKLVDLISTRRILVAGGVNGSIAMWSTGCGKICAKQRPIKTFCGHEKGIYCLCNMNGHLVSADVSGKVLMWSGYDMENPNVVEPVPRVVGNFPNLSCLVEHERWFASGTYKDGNITIWTLPEMWLRTG